MFKVQYGELTKASYHYCHHYKALPKKVAFRNGKLLAFMATDASGQSYEQSEKWEKFFAPWIEEHYESGPGLSELVWLMHTYPEVDVGKILPLIASEEWWDREDKSHGSFRGSATVFFKY